MLNITEIAGNTSLDLLEAIALGGFALLGGLALCMSSFYYLYTKGCNVVLVLDNGIEIDDKKAKKLAIRYLLTAVILFALIALCVYSKPYFTGTNQVKNVGDYYRPTLHQKEDLVKTYAKDSGYGYLEQDFGSFADGTYFLSFSTKDKKVPYTLHGLVTYSVVKEKDLAVLQILSVGDKGAVFRGRDLVTLKVSKQVLGDTLYNEISKTLETSQKEKAVGVS